MSTLNQLFKVSQTYDCVTPESAEIGDFSESGYEFKDSPMSFREILWELKNQGISEIDTGFGSTLNVRGWTYTDNYKTGEEKTRYLHISGHARALSRLKKLIGGVK